MIDSSCRFRGGHPERRFILKLKGPLFGSDSDRAIRIFWDLWWRDRGGGRN